MPSNTDPRPTPSTPLHPEPKRAATSRTISRPLHAVLDYVMGGLIAGSPWLFGFSGEYLAPQIALTAGIALVFISMVTHYELGVVQLLPFAVHRVTDFAIGIALLGAPWHFSIGGRAGVVLALLGILQIFIAAFTRRPEEAGTILS